MKQVSLGHYTASSEHIKSLEWSYFIGQDPIDPEKYGQDAWNYDQDLALVCDVEVDMESLRRHLRLDPATELAWVIVARSDAPLVSVSTPSSVRPGRQTIEHAVRGYEISGRLRAELQLGISKGVTTPRDRFSPHLTGHLVYQESASIQLEGSGGQLPLLPVSFKQHGISHSEYALWWLHVLNSDLEAPTSSALWLWLNTDNTLIRSLVENPLDPANQSTSELLAVDLSRQLLGLALSDKLDDLALDEEYPAGSLGESLVGVVRLLGETREQVRQAHDLEPGRLEAQLQALVIGAARSEHEDRS